MIERVTMYGGAVALSGYALSIDGEAALAMALGVIGVGAGLGHYFGTKAAGEK
jgi:hypothetical protein